MTELYGNFWRRSSVDRFEQAIWLNNIEGSHVYPGFGAGIAQEAPLEALIWILSSDISKPLDIPELIKVLIHFGRSDVIPSVVNQSPDVQHDYHAYYNLAIQYDDEQVLEWLQERIDILGA